MSRQFSIDSRRCSAAAPSDPTIGLRAPLAVRLALLRGALVRAIDSRPGHARHLQVLLDRVERLLRAAAAGTPEPPSTAAGGAP